MEHAIAPGNLARLFLTPRATTLFQTAVSIGAPTGPSGRFSPDGRSPVGRNCLIEPISNPGIPIGKA